MSALLLCFTCFIAPAVTAPSAVTAPQWHLTAGATGSLTEGNTSTRTFGTNFDLSREAPRTFVEFRSNAQYGRIRNPGRRPDPQGTTLEARAGMPPGPFVENVNNWLGLIKGGWYLTQGRRNYVYTAIVNEGDHFRGFWMRPSAQAGFGRNVVEGVLTLKGEVGIDFAEEYQVAHHIRSRLAFALNGNATWLATKTLSISEEFSHARALSTNDPLPNPLVDWWLRSRTAISVRITEHFMLQTDILWQYASRPVPGAYPTDVRITQSLLYTFL